MKKVLLSAIAMLSLGLSNQALAAEIWDCGGESDPDHIDVSVHKEGEKYFMVLREYYGDGDSYAEDAVQVERIAPHLADFVTFVQVPNKYPRTKLAKKATKETEGAVLRIALFKGGDSNVIGRSGPSGNELMEPNLVCVKSDKK
jgi:hypothetical protein